MKDIVVLEWTFTPADYFEDTIQIVKQNYEMTIENGKVEAKIEAQHYDSESDSRLKLHESLNSRFVIAQIYNRKPFDLSKPSMCRIHPDGRRTQYLHPESIRSKATVGTPDLIVTDPSGNVIRDSRKERIERRNVLAELVEKHRKNNPILQSLMNSWRSSIHDPHNELIHLYEVRDALVKEFGNEVVARNTLGISKKLWGKLGRLANFDPLKQGRHRGWHAKDLRDATENELNEARTIARALFEKYLDYLEQKSMTAEPE